MKKLLLILLCLPMIGFGQGWQKTFLDLYAGKSVKQTSDGGYIICGTTIIDTSNTNIYLIKVDVNGDEQWRKTYGGTNEEEGNDVALTSDGGYIIIGETSSYGNGDDDVYLIKTDASGNEQWTKTFGQGYYDRGNSVKQTIDGGYILCGTLNNEDMYLIKTDANGNELWSNTFTGLGLWNTIYGESVQQTNDGGYIVCGTIDSYCGSDGIYLVKTNSLGNEIWSNIVGNAWPSNDKLSIKQTNDGGYIICTTTEINNGTCANELFSLIKTDSNGNEQWIKTYGGSFGFITSFGASVNLTSDGGYIATGDGFISVNDVLTLSIIVVKTDVNGTTQWIKTIGNNTTGYSVRQTIDGGYILAGGYDFSFTNYFSYLFLVKLDANGNITSNFNIPINPNRKLQKTVDLLGRESKPQKNIPFIEIYDDGTVEKKITID